MKTNLIAFLALLLIIPSCISQYHWNIYSKNHPSWTTYKCKEIKELNLSNSQKRWLNTGAKRHFGKENLENLCYTMEVDEKGFGLVEATKFASHPSKLLFIFSDKHLEVLESEKKTLKLIDSFESKIKQFEKDFDPSTVEKMRAYIVDYYK